jgi:hypothetical protein
MWPTPILFQSDSWTLPERAVAIRALGWRLRDGLQLAQTLRLKLLGRARPRAFSDSRRYR